MDTSAYFSQHVVWNTSYTPINEHAVLSFTLERLQAPGEPMLLETDPPPQLNPLGDRGSDVLVDAVLALIPADASMTCALVSNPFFAFGQRRYQYVRINGDRAPFRDVYGARIPNAQSMGDVVFVGGHDSDHQPAVLEYGITTLRQTIGHDVVPPAPISTLLARYSLISFSQSNIVAVLLRDGNANYTRTHSRLAAVAAQYGLVLPPELQPQTAS